MKTTRELTHTYFRRFLTIFLIGTSLSGFASGSPANAHGHLVKLQSEGLFTKSFTVTIPANKNPRIWVRAIPWTPQTAPVKSLRINIYNRFNNVLLRTVDFTTVPEKLYFQDFISLPNDRSWKVEVVPLSNWLAEYAVGLEYGEYLQADQ